MREIAASLQLAHDLDLRSNPVSWAAANATIWIIEEDRLADRAERIGHLVRGSRRVLNRLSSGIVPGTNAGEERRRLVASALW